MSDVIYNPPIRITIPTPIAETVRSYRRGIHNRSNAGNHLSIRLSAEEEYVIAQACKVLQMPDRGSYMRWCAVQVAEEIAADHAKWEKVDEVR